jgi:hypothetical protein
VRPSCVAPCQRGAAASTPPPPVPTNGQTQTAVRPEHRSEAVQALVSARTAPVPGPAGELFPTIKEAAQCSGLTEAYIRRLIEAGILPAIRFGR